jgi:hypothetical protein
MDSLLPEYLEYLAVRLERAALGDLLRAASLVRKVIATPSVLLRGNGEAEHAFYWTLWGCISDALDNDDVDPVYAIDVKALETEMAGQTLTWRQARGWLVKPAEGAPDSFRGIDEFL